MTCDWTIFLLHTSLVKGVVIRQPRQVAPEQFHSDWLRLELQNCITLFARCAVAIVIIFTILCPAGLCTLALHLCKVLLIDVGVVVNILAHGVAVLRANILVLNQRCSRRQAVLGVRALSLLLACRLIALEDFFLLSNPGREDVLNALDWAAHLVADDPGRVDARLLLSLGLQALLVLALPLHLRQVVVRFVLVPREVVALEADLAAPDAVGDLDLGALALLRRQVVVDVLATLLHEQLLHVVEVRVGSGGGALQP